MVDDDIYPANARRITVNIAKLPEPLGQADTLDPICSGQEHDFR
jgi:hypothetical protein